GGGRRRARGRHGKGTRQRLREEVDLGLDRVELIRGTAGLERAVERRRGLGAAGVGGREAGLRGLGPALRDGLRLLADGAHLLAEADVRTRLAAGDDLEGVGDHVVDRGLEGVRVEVVHVTATDQAVALVARLREAGVEGVLRLGDAVVIDRDALL